MAKEAKDIVLISGVNGYIAAQVAKAFLDAGFKVRGTTRKTVNTKSLTEGPLKAAFEAGDFEVAEVPDITIPGAFDEAVKDVIAILHTAAPVSLTFTDPEPVMHAAIQGTSSILNSALKAGPQLKSLVFMSSIAAVMGAQQQPHTFTEKDWNNYSEGEVARSGKAAGSIHIYFASKTAAERTLWDFQKKHSPSFAITSINPV
jgi:nucleoside-diphosphate-sugar epimerase